MELASIDVLQAGLDAPQVTRLCHRPGIQHADVGPGPDEVLGQGSHPAEDRRHLTAGERDPSGLLDQIRSPLEIPGGQGVAHRFGNKTVLLIPCTRPAVQLRHELGDLALRALAQQIGEQAMVTIPAALVIEGNDEEVTPFEILEHGL